MSDSTAIVGSFYDFSGLRQLRANATEDDSSSAAGKAASEFEAAFMQLMFQSMKQASEPLKSDLLDDSSSEYFEDMFLNEMAHYIASRQSLGLGKWIDETLGNQQLK
jgi:Rod binding domain-containing protein